MKKILTTLALGTALTFSSLDVQAYRSSGNVLEDIRRMEEDNARLNQRVEAERRAREGGSSYLPQILLCGTLGVAFGIYEARRQKKAREGSEED